MNIILMDRFGKSVIITRILGEIYAHCLECGNFPRDQIFFVIEFFNDLIERFQIYR